MCKGLSVEVHRMLKMAPNQPEYNDYAHFKFKMFHQNVNKQREEIFISPIALAVNIGDYAMVDSLLNYFKNLKIEEGIHAKSLTPSVVVKNQKLTIRRFSPVQYACSLGLFTILDRLLHQGANPNGLDGSYDQIIDEGDTTKYNYHDGESPLIICLQKKYQNQSL